MAITGKSYVPITAARRAAGMPVVKYVAEDSSVTATRGAAVLYSSGYIGECGTDPSAVYGFLETAAHNDASQGTHKARVLVATPGAEFYGTLKATLTQAMLGSVANLVAGSSTWYLDTSTSVSSAAQCNIVGPGPGFAIGDINPVVIFTLKSSKTQYI